MGPAITVALRRMCVEIEHTPVVDDQGEPSRGFGQRGTNGVEGGLDEGVEGDLIVVDEAGHGACGGHGSGGARQGGEARDQRVDGVRVFAHELPEPNLVTAVQEAEMIAMPTQTTKSKSCVHTYAQPAEVVPCPVLLALSRFLPSPASPDS